VLIDPARFEANPVPRAMKEDIDNDTPASWQLWVNIIESGMNAGGCQAVLPSETLWGHWSCIETNIIFVNIIIIIYL